MVVITEAQQRQWAARRVVEDLGASSGRLDAADRANPGLDWLAMVWALDRVFLAYGGSVAQAHFLASPSLVLDGQTPLEALVEPEALERVRQAAHSFAAQAPSPAVSIPAAPMM